jgi:hypothetical protein
MRHQYYTIVRLRDRVTLPTHSCNIASVKQRSGNNGFEFCVLMNSVIREKSLKKQRVWKPKHAEYHDIHTATASHITSTHHETNAYNHKNSQNSHARLLRVRILQTTSRRIERVAPQSQPRFVNDHRPNLAAPLSHA